MRNIFAGLALSGAALASGEAMAQSMRPMLDFEVADNIRNECLDYASDTDHALAVAVYDHGGNLVSFARAAGASPGTAAFAMWKGQSAALYRNPSSVTGTWDDAVHGPKIATVAGGVPIFTEDGIGLGGVGVSGGPPEFDAECATHAIRFVGLSTGGAE